MLASTWRTWPDPLVDYGREAYLAWQVAGGKTLYVDVAHFNGPLSVYVNALFLRIFGPSILALALTNAALAAGCIAMIYSLLVRVADRLAATFAGITFVTLFACARFVRLGNYNWLCPYSYELPHGVMVGIAALWCLDRYHRTRRLGWLAAMGAARARNGAPVPEWPSQHLSGGHLADEEEERCEERQQHAARERPENADEPAARGSGPTTWRETFESSRWRRGGTPSSSLPGSPRRSPFEAPDAEARSPSSSAS
jgi:hypothetical protein